VELAKEGQSFAQIAAALDVSRQTIDNWAQEHPEFLEALARAKAHAQAWWETAGQSNLLTGGFNAQVWKTTMQARFRDDYTEKIVNEHTGKDGGPIQTERKPDLSDLDPDERDTIRAILGRRAKEPGSGAS
jgi:hypothetical protein